MKYIRESKLVKVLSLMLAIHLVTDLILPTMSFGLTSGPSQPEFASFEPVATTNMVDSFTGSFTYNLPVMSVPGPNGGGYAVSLNYHSGISPEQESSWCGLGWNINPGAINRSQIGIADDHKGVKVHSYHKNRDQHTITGRTNVPFEIASWKPVTASLGVGASWNNYKGYSRDVSFGITSFGLISLDMTLSSDRTSPGFTATLHPGKIFQQDTQGLENEMNAEDIRRRKAGKEKRFMPADIFLTSLNKSVGLYEQIQRIKKKNKRTENLGAKYDLHSLSNFAMGLDQVPYFGVSATFKTSYMANVLPFDMSSGLEWSGSYSWQGTKDTSQSNSFGLLYGSQALASDNKDVKSSAQMDYHMEREDVYNKRDKNLPIPFSNPDVFMATGEGAMGGFKLRDSYVGHYFPKFSESEMVMVNAGVEQKAGTGIEIGAPDLTAGASIYRIGSWKASRIGSGDDFSFRDESSNARFTFDGDPSGDRDYTNSDHASFALLRNQGRAPKLGSDIKSQVNDNGEISSSSYIGYNTLESMSETIDSKSGPSIAFRSYNKREDIRNKFLSNNVTDDVLAASIGEFAVTNTGGQQYVYGLPVYSAMSSSMSYGINNLHEDDIVNSVRVKTGLKEDVYTNVDERKSAMGSETKAPVANTFLLTQICDADYIDRTMDGPSNDDWGGWTKFNYSRAFGSNDKTVQGSNGYANWYKWRSPYTLQGYDKMNRTDVRDDKALVQKGVKEIYYVESIETKTHIAYFITNETDLSVPHETKGTIQLSAPSASNRNDGIEAALESQASINENAKGAGKLQKLERIELYAKSPSGKITGETIQTVHLEYATAGSSEELCHGVTNALNTGDGKLTLKRVWFEHQDVKSHLIRPYEFSYAYKPALEYGDEIKERYPKICNYERKGGVSTGVLLEQNPDYSQYSIDTWGNYRPDGENRSDNLEPWVQQNGELDDFDPAAWHLKGIRLPSGGEILVQYEQNDYQYVQSDKACTLISLRTSDYSSSGVKDEDDLMGNNQQDNLYYINYDDVDMDVDGDGAVDDVDVIAYEADLNEFLADNKLFFRFLYRLKRGAGTDPSLNDCGSDFIEGYADAEVHREEAAGLDRLYIKFTHPNEYDLPRTICRAYVKTNLSGRPLDGSCEPEDDSENWSKNLGQAVAWYSSWLSALVPGDELTWCKSISVENSYFKLPVPKSKKGGGVRVKRLLMYDRMGDEGEEVLYGTEYSYVDAEGGSSGVATNEPFSSTADHTLVRFMSDERVKFANRALAGSARTQFEGPIGSSVMPGPSIGYSRVITSNIHTGETSPGFVVNEYHTAKDGGTFVAQPSRLEAAVPEILIVPFGDLTIDTKRRWVSQGYSFILNDLHGKQKRTRTYPGAYKEYTETELSDLVASVEQSFEYSVPGQTLDVMESDGSIQNRIIGRQERLSMEMKKVEDFSSQLGGTTDPGLGIMGLIIPYFSVYPIVQLHNYELNRHVTSKVIRYKTFLTSVTSTTKGVQKTVENLVFDANTGNPVVTRVSDGYHNLLVNNVTHEGRYVNYEVPAAHVYPLMGQKSQNERFTLEGDLQLFTDCKAVPEWIKEGGVCHLTNAFINIQGEQAGEQSVVRPFKDSNGNPVPSSIRQDVIDAVNDGKLVEGDLVLLSDDLGSKALFFINEIDMYHMQRIYLQAMSEASNDLIDTPDDPVFSKLEVIRSGYTNQLAASAGSVSTYGNGTVQNLLNVGVEKTEIVDDIQGVVSAGVVTYSDDWYDYATASMYGGADDLCDRPRSFEVGARGKWRPRSTYAYETSIKPRDITTGGLIQDAGVYEGAFDGFTYQEDRSVVYLNSTYPKGAMGEFINEPINGANWVELNKVNAYSPHGEPLEEENKLGIKSCARFAHGDNVPSLVAGNAGLSNVIFKSFEDDNDNISTSAHTGLQSLNLAGQQVFSLGTIESAAKTDGTSDILVKVWAKIPHSALSDLDNTLSLVASWNDGVGSGQHVADAWRVVATVGEWTLLETEISGLTTIDVFFDSVHKRGRGPGRIYDLKIQNLGTSEVQIDDFRAQPSESEMTTYVYEPGSLRLLAQFDGQHFARLYQYNAEGQLMRQMIETKEGVKTVAESQVNVPGTLRAQ